MNTSWPLIAQMNTDFYLLRIFGLDMNDTNERIKYE